MSFYRFQTDFTDKFIYWLLFLFYFLTDRPENFPDHKFHMLIKDFGHESLVLKLAKMGYTIYLDNERVKFLKTPDLAQYFCKDRNAAKIILIDQLDAQNVEQQFVDEKIISIEFTADDKVCDSHALRFIKFSVHPTMADINHIATLTAPLHIYTIGHSLDFPFKLSYLCRSGQPTTAIKRKNNQTKI